MVVQVVQAVGHGAALHRVLARETNLPSGFTRARILFAVKFFVIAGKVRRVLAATRDSFNAAAGRVRSLS
jgi:hypothetical protein